MPGRPYTDFATGWYQIGYAAELAPGQVTAARWLNQDLVLFRTESGRLALMDAYCPHMGADLGHPGEFCGEVLQCPWHGWKWDTEGRNAEIPYRPEQTVKARLATKEVREIGEMIFMWYDHAGGPPTYEWPGLPYVGDKNDYYPIDTTVDGPHLANPSSRTRTAQTRTTSSTCTGPAATPSSRTTWSTGHSVEDHCHQGGRRCRGASREECSPCARCRVSASSTRPLTWQARSAP